MSMSIKKRLALGAGALATVGAVGTLAAGVTFGLFTASSPAQSNTFSSGTVTMTSDATGICQVTNAVPGDSGTCTLVATYTGSAPAYMGLDVSATGALLSSLNNDTNGLHYTVTDDQSVSYATASNDLVNVTPETSGAASHTFTVSWDIPKTTDNTFQNKSATITLQAHAVQSQHNPEAGTACTAGTSCSDISWT